MSIRALPSAIFLCAATAAFGCSGQPAAPSGLDSPPAAGPSDAASPAAAPPQAAASAPAANLLRFGERTPGVVYVTSQGLYYDTFAVKDPLPPKGRFQQLADGQTEFGPGQPGYLGGRWWVDVNDNGVQDPEDHYFLCPLLPPGRPNP